MVKKAKSKKKPTLTKEQKAAKAEADARLTFLLEVHSSWLNKKVSESEGRLNWHKLKPVFEVYRDAGLGNPSLAGCNLQDADFSNAELPEGLSFEMSYLYSSSFENSTLTGVHFSGCNMERCNFSGATAKRCLFFHTFLSYSEFIDSTLINCWFDKSEIGVTTFYNATIIKTSFQYTDLSESNFSDCRTTNTNFTGADLTRSMLVRVGFSDATLTGAYLYGTARSDWNIEGIECQYVYWDENGKERFPPNRDFRDGEFEKLYKKYDEFSYVFENGITPFHITLVSHVVKEINDSNLGFIIQEGDVSLYGDNPVLKVLILSGKDTGFPISELFRMVFEQKLARFSGNDSHDLLGNAQQQTALTKKSSPAIPVAQEATRQLIESIEKDADDTRTKILISFNEGTLSKLEHDDLKERDYIALFSLGTEAMEIPTHELNQRLTELEKLLPKKCLLAFDLTLDRQDEGSTAKRTFSCFEERKKGAFIAIATISKGINDELYYSPVYNELILAPETAFHECIQDFLDSLIYKTIADFKLPPLTGLRRKLVCVNGKRIRELRGTKMKKLYGMTSKKFLFSGVKNLAGRTLDRIENNNPTQDDIIKEIAKFLKTSPKSLILTQVAPNYQKLKRLRELTELSADQLSLQFGVASPRFFHLLETEESIPAKSMLFAYCRYKSILKQESDSGNINKVSETELYELYDSVSKGKH